MVSRWRNYHGSEIYGYVCFRNHSPLLLKNPLGLYCFAAEEQCFSPDWAEFSFLGLVTTFIGWGKHYRHNRILSRYYRDFYNKIATGVGPWFGSKCDQRRCEEMKEFEIIRTQKATMSVPADT